MTAEKLSKALSEMPGLGGRANDSLLTPVAAENFLQRCKTSFAAHHDSGFRGGPEGSLLEHPQTTQTPTVAF